MLKQVVCEVVMGSSVVIMINGVEAKKYCKNPEQYRDYQDADLNGKKEFQEVRIGNVTKYWVGVPDAVANKVTKEYFDHRKLRHKKKMELKRKLIIAKKIRMMRYAEQIARDEKYLAQGVMPELIEGIQPTSQEINDALSLKKMEVRKHKGVEELFAV